MDKMTKKEESQIIYTCMRKCINDFDKRVLNPSEKICLSRCSFKYIDAIHYGNRVINIIENKINSTEENN